MCHGRIAYGALSSLWATDFYFRYEGLGDWRRDEPAHTLILKGLEKHITNEDVRKLTRPHVNLRTVLHLMLLSFYRMQLLASWSTLGFHLLPVRPAALVPVDIFVICHVDGSG
jgi:hypothetical protein